MDHLGLEVRALRGHDMSFRVGRLPAFLHQLAQGREWRLLPLARSYDRITFERSVSEADPRFEWITPGHPLFEVVRRHTEEETRSHFRRGVLFYELQREEPSLLELFTASVADGAGATLHQRLFLVESTLAGGRRLREPTYLLDLNLPEEFPSAIPEVPLDDEQSRAFFFTQALQAFLAEVEAERRQDLEIVDAM